MIEGEGEGKEGGTADEVDAEVDIDRGREGAGCVCERLPAGREIFSLSFRGRARRARGGGKEGEWWRRWRMSKWWRRLDRVERGCGSGVAGGIRVGGRTRKESVGGRRVESGGSKGWMNEIKWRESGKRVNATCGGRVEVV